MSAGSSLWWSAATLYGACTSCGAEVGAASDARWVEELREYGTVARSLAATKTSGERL